MGENGLPTIGHFKSNSISNINVYTMYVTRLFHSISRSNTKTLQNSEGNWGGRPNWIGPEICPTQDFKMVNTLYQNLFSWVLTIVIDAKVFLSYFSGHMF